MNNFLWCSGIAAWGALAIFGLLAISDHVIDYTVNSFWTQREFLAFVKDRLKRGRASGGG